MSGLLDGGLQSVFGTIFGAVYQNWTLNKAAIVDDGKGGMTQTFTPTPVKGMVDSYSDYVRTSAQIPDTDVKLRILQLGVPSGPVKDDQVVADGVTYKVMAPITQDPAQAYWECRGSPVG